MPTIKRVATSFNFLTPRPWETCMARPFATIEGEHVLAEKQYLTKIRSYCCIPPIIERRTSLPDEFFNHEIIRLKTSNEQEMLDFISTYGMPIFPSKENIVANKAYNDAIWSLCVFNEMNAEEFKQKLTHNELGDAGCRMIEGTTPEEFIDGVFNIERILAAAISKVEASIRASVNSGVIASCSIKREVLNKYLVSPDIEFVPILSPTCEIEIKQTIIQAILSAESIKSLQTGEETDTARIAKTLDVQESDVIAQLESGDGFVNACIAGISNRIGISVGEEVHYGSLLSYSYGEEQGSITEAIGAQLYNAAISDTHWRPCDKCGTLFKIKRSMSKYGYHHSDSSFCCDDCANAFRQTRARRVAKAKKAAKENIPLEDFLASCEPKFHESVIAAYRTITNPAR